MNAGMSYIFKFEYCLERDIDFVEYIVECLGVILWQGWGRVHPTFLYAATNISLGTN